MAERDLVGYGRAGPNIRWPGGARLAVSLVVNYEEGAERSFALGDGQQESLTEWGSYPSPGDIRNLAMESMYEYGSRVGVWRILDLLRKHSVKSTFFACAVAFEKAPDVAHAAVADGHEICSHGYRWEEVFRLSPDEERAHIRLAVESITRTCGRRPLGWYCRYGPSEQTRKLLVEEGGFLYDSDAYNDDVPYFVEVDGKRHLVVPYTPDANDIQFWLAEPLATTNQFFDYLRDSFDALYQESDSHPKMMSVGLHCRIIGRPGRIGALDKFITHAKTHPEVWFATRAEIAEWWIKQTAVDQVAEGYRGPAGPPRGVAKVPLEDAERTSLAGGAWSKLLISLRNVPGTKSTVGYGFFPAGVVTQLISHEEEEWMFVVAGRGELRTGTENIGFQAGDALHIPAHTWHQIANLGTEDLITVFGFPRPEYPATSAR